jgi:ADP-ribosyl-[dinitrogen reductase] hydrolase
MWSDARQMDEMDHTGEPSPTERFIGCLLGQAIGDALGMPSTGMRPATIEQRFGQIARYLPLIDAEGLVASEAGQVSANTELALCLAESLIAANGFVDPQTAGYRFLQVLDGEHGHFLGNTTRRTLEIARETWEFQNGLGGVGTAGVGPAARVAPVALVHSLGRMNVEVFVREVLRSALITHSAPESINGALGIAWAINLLVRRETPPAMLIPEVLSFIDEDDVARNLRNAERLLLARRAAGDDPSALSRIGTSGWVAEAVPAALYLASAYADDFESGVVAAASAGGASDAIGAMVALIGAWTGPGVFPEPLIEGVESRMYILMAAPALYRVAQRRAGLYLQLHPR